MVIHILLLGIYLKIKNINIILLSKIEIVFNN